jgi:tripartite-type tricarboxylate transporter receptor subunit TctC
MITSVSRRRSLAKLSITAVLLAASSFLGLAHAENDVAEFYRGRQVNLIVGYGPGGGYDLTARLVGRYMAKYLPGNPNIVVQNMPGAGSMRAVNYIYSVAPNDGTTFGLFGSDMPMIGILGTNSSARFDSRKFTWLGSSSSFANDAFILLVRADAAVKSLADARRPGGPPLLLGGTGEGARDADVPKILRDTLGLNIKQVLSYPDSPSIFLAVERAELDGRTFDLSSVQTNRPGWLKPNSGYNVFLQFARSTRHPALPDVPTARELAPDDKTRALIEFAETPLLTMSRPFAAPPSVPDERAKALQTAFLAAHRDAQFLAEAKQLGLDISPVGPEDILRAIEDMSHASPATIDYMRRLQSH